MNRDTSIIARLSFVLAAIILSGFGCAQTVCLKFVDSKTGTLLVGVSAVWHEYDYNLLSGHKHETGPTNLPLSDEHGIILIKNVHAKRANSLIFSYSGYLTLYGNVNDANIWLTQRMHEVPNDTFVLDQPFTEAESSNSCFIIKMVK